MLLYCLTMLLHRPDFKKYRFTMFGFVPGVGAKPKVIAENYDLARQAEQNNPNLLGPKLKRPMVFDLFRREEPRIDPVEILSRPLFEPILMPIFKPVLKPKMEENFGKSPKQEPKYENDAEGFSLVPMMLPLTPFSKEPRLF